MKLLSGGVHLVRGMEAVLALACDEAFACGGMSEDKEEGRRGGGEGRHRRRRGWWKALGGCEAGLMFS